MAELLQRVRNLRDKGILAAEAPGDDVVTVFRSAPQVTVNAHIDRTAIVVARGIDAESGAVVVYRGVADGADGGATVPACRAGHGLGDGVPAAAAGVTAVEVKAMRIRFIR